MNDTLDPRDRLIADLKAVLVDADDIMKLTAENASGKLAEAREKMKVHLATAKDCLATSEKVITATAKQAAKSADHYVQENPWKSIGVAAGVGLVLGLLIGRR